MYTHEVYIIFFDSRRRLFVIEGRAKHANSGVISHSELDLTVPGRHFVDVSGGDGHFMQSTAQTKFPQTWLHLGNY